MPNRQERPVSNIPNVPNSANSANSGHSASSGHAANVAHFAINADDVARARRFYEQVFGWRFEAWGPPGFLQVVTGTDSQPGIRGALQKRRELVAGQPTIGYECSVAVQDVDAVAAAVVANGGTILIPRTLIPTVGHLIFARDTEGNVVGAMQYDPNAQDEI